MLRFYVVFFSLVMLSIGCVSTKEEYTKTSELPKGEVIQRPGERASQISEIKPNKWISIRQKAKSDEVKLISLLGAGEVDPALGAAKDRLLKHPGDLTALMVLSAGHGLKMDYQLASYYAGILSKLHGDQPIGYNLRALALIQQGEVSLLDYKKAVRLFQMGFDASKSEVASGLNLGQVLMEMGHSDQAEQVFTEVAARCEDCIPALLGKATALTRLRKYPEARSTLIRVIEKNADNLRAHYRLALVAYVGMQDLSTAETHLRKVVEDKSDLDKGVKRRANYLLRRIESEKLNESPPKVVFPDALPVNDLEN